MAITACFAGPVFNMLIGLSLGYELYFSESDSDETEVSFYLIFWERRGRKKGEGVNPSATFCYYSYKAFFFLFPTNYR